MKNEVTLKEHFDTKFRDMEKAIDTAYEAMGKRLEGMNEFRDQLKDQAARFITRDELDAKLENLNKNKKDNTTLILSLVGIIIGILSIGLRLFNL